MKYKAVLFDLFGTLILMDDFKAELEEWLSRFHECLQPHGLTVSRESFDEVCFANLEKDIPVETEGGLTIFEHRVSAICTHLGLQVMTADIKSTVGSLLEIWNKYAVLDPDCHPLLEKLVQRYSLGIVSNFDHPPYIRRILRDLDLNKYFSMVVISGDHDFKKPDPRIFHIKANTTSMIDRPGAKERMGLLNRYVRPSSTISPQAAAGGSIPMPRKLRPASASIAAPICIVISTINGGKQLGKMCLIIIRILPAPTAYSAST